MKHNFICFYELRKETHNIYIRYIGRVKRKSAFEHAQNAQIQIILRMRKVPPGPLLSIHTSVVPNASVSGQ